MKVRKIAFVCLGGLLTSSGAYGATCESLKSLSLDHATITLAEPVPAGQFTLPSNVALTPNVIEQVKALAKQLPAFCRVAATLKPSSDSDIKIEVWMPASGWNGKFMGI